MLFEALIYLFYIAYILVSIAISVGLFWKMQAIERPFLANVWWLLIFLPLFWTLVEVVADQTAGPIEKSLAIFVAGGLLVGWFLIRYMNPLSRDEHRKPTGQDGISG